MTKPFVELHCHSNFSFLDGASHPHELAERAAELEMPALAITDTGRDGRRAELKGALGRDRVFVELLKHRRAEDSGVMAQRAGMARRHRAPLVATDQARYHAPRRRPLHDVLVAIKHKASLDEVR